jgi:hypothetical protein
LKQEIDTLLAKLRNAEKELVIIRERDIQSPKKTVITTGSRDEGKRSIIISHVDRESEGEDYGENYQEYINEDQNGQGTT